MAPVCTMDGRQAAQVMIICRCDNGSVDCRAGSRTSFRRRMGAEHGGCTPVPQAGLMLFSYRFYNQDLTTGSLLIEIGGHGNNLNEALYAGQLAANGLVQALLSPGCQQKRRQSEPLLTNAVIGKSSASQRHRERGRAGSRARTVRERTPGSSKLNRAQWNAHQWCRAGWR